MLINFEEAEIANGTKAELITGMQDNSIITDVTVFPNPAKDKLNIRGDIQNAQLYIYDLTGNVVMKKENVTDGSSVNLSEIKAGIYMVRIVENEKVFNTKIGIVH